LNHLFDRISREENYYFLSGLIIGTEVGSLTKRGKEKITLVASGGLAELYKEALNWFGVEEETGGLMLVDADEALVKGQLAMLKRSMGVE
jgi:2-dehydro-3-deoxygalactonokinase